VSEVRKRLRLLVSSPVRTVLEVDGASWGQVRLADEGWLGIYPGHAPLLAETMAGPLRYADDDGEHALDVLSGILHVCDGEVALSIGDDEALFEEAEQLTVARFDRLARSLLLGMKAQVDAGDGEPSHDSF